MGSVVRERMAMDTVMPLNETTTSTLFVERDEILWLLVKCKGVCPPDQIVVLGNALILTAITFLL